MQVFIRVWCEMWGCRCTAGGRKPCLLSEPGARAAEQEPILTALELPELPPAATAVLWEWHHSCPATTGHSCYFCSAPATQKVPEVKPFWLWSPLESWCETAHFWVGTNTAIPSDAQQPAGQCLSGFGNPAWLSCIATILLCGFVTFCCFSRLKKWLQIYVMFL